MSIKTAFILILSLPLLIFNLGFFPKYSLAAQEKSYKQILGASEKIEQESLSNTFYSFYWLSLISILALPVVLRLLRMNKEDDIDESDLPDESTGFKGGLSTGRIEEGQEDDL